MVHLHLKLGWRLCGGLTSMNKSNSEEMTNLCSTNAPRFGALRHTMHNPK
jgi:hypothetical protein